MNSKIKYTYALIINFIIIFIYAILSTIFIVNQDLFKGFSMDGLHNNFCKENPNDIICINKYKKKKLFYCILDGVAYDQLFELQKKNKYNITRIFRGITSDYKQSAVNFQIIFGGKINRNFVGISIKEDNMFYTLFNKGMSFSFRGIKLVIYGLVGHFFEKYKITPTEINSMDTMCDFGIDIQNNQFIEGLIKKISDKYGYIKSGYDKEYLYQELDNYFSNELNKINERGENDFMTKCLREKFNYTGKESIIYYGNKIDHLNHNYDKNHIRVILQMYLSEKIIIRCINWCYDHPEYGFFFASDHGGQNFYGEDNIMNHGYNSKGNEAIFFGWAKEFSENYEKLKLDDKIVDLFDFSTLVPQIMEGAVIPLESLGVPYPFANDSLFYITSIKSKAQQLLKYIELFVKKYPKNQNILENYNNTIYQIYNSNESKLLEKPESYLNELKNYQNEIDYKLREYNKNLIFTIIFHIIFVCFGLAIVYDIYILKKLVNTNNLFFIIILIFGIYFSTLCVFLYPSNKIYDKIYVSTINQYYSFSFLMICYIIIYNYSKIKNHNEIIFNSFFAVLLICISLISTLLYKFELFTKMKKLFTNLILAKLCDFLVFFPLFGIFILREISKLKGLYFDKKCKYSAYKIFLVNGILIFTFMAIFELLVPISFEVHTIYSLITNYCVYLFLIFFFCSSFLKYYSKNKQHSYQLGEKEPVDGFPLFKLFLILYQFYLSDESERTLLLLIIMPLLEFISSKFLRQEKIWKLIVLVCLMGLGEIFYLITQRYYSFDVSIKVLSRTIEMTAEDSPIFSGILMGTHKLRYLLLVQGYLMSLNRFYKTNNTLFTETTFMIKLVLYMQIIGKIIFFYYRYFQNLVGEEFLELFMWTMLHMIMFGLDLLGIIIYIVVNKIYNLKIKKIKLHEENNSNISIDKSTIVSINQK